jgi:elongator complex protein 6
MSSQTTPLESSLSGLLLSVAHQADQVISLRLLDTGTARDVSGVCRINVESGGDCQEAQKLESQELLYLVGGDGGVKVFERG